MKRLLLLLLLVNMAASAQERILLKGEVLGQGEALENVHIRNVTSQQVTVSDQDGLFYLNTAVGDTLLFTHVTMQDLIKFVSQEELQNGSISVNMVLRDHELEEVLLEDSGINAVSLGIISEKKEIPTTYERRLQTAGDFKWYHLFGIIGGGLSLDPILNSINGRTKKMKRNVEIERKIEHIHHLNENYLVYMKENFDATEAEVQQFWDYIVEQEDLMVAIDLENEEGLKFYLTDHWFKYKKRLE